LNHDLNQALEKIRNPKNKDLLWKARRAALATSNLGPVRQGPSSLNVCLNFYLIFSKTAPAMQNWAPAPASFHEKLKLPFKLKCTAGSKNSSKTFKQKFKLQGISGVLTE